MKVDTYQCDACKTRKQDANHWFKGYLLDRDTNNQRAGVMVLEWEINSISQPIQRHDLLPETADAHLCGAQCVTEWLSKNLLN